MLFYICNIIYDLASNLISDKTNVTEILPGLWLGNYQSSIDLHFLTENKIDFIMNCTTNTPFFNEIYEKKSLKDLKNIDTYRIPVNDSLLEKDFLLMQKYLKIVLPILVNKYIHEKKHILIHCQAGKQRSAIVVAALLKILIDKNYTNIDSIPKNISKTEQYQLIYNYLLSKRPQVFTYGLRVNFDTTYKRFFNF